MLTISKIDFRKPHTAAMLFFVVCLALASFIFQDYLHSRFNNYSFYLDESLLFNTFWLLFLPLFIFQKRVLSFIIDRGVTKLFSYVIGIILPSIIHLLLFPAMIWCLSLLLFSHTYTFFQTLSYTLADNALTFLAAYGSATFIHIYFTNNSVTSKRDTTPVLRNLTFNVGGKYCALHVSEIIYISTAAPYIAVHTNDRQFLYSKTLKWIEQELDSKQFVRVHKSTIINVHYVVSYQSRLNGDYDILLTNNSKVRLSRNYSAAFKSTLKSYSC